MLLWNQTNCALSPKRDETLHDDMKTFGSVGGEWLRMGLSDDQFQRLSSRRH